MNKETWTVGVTNDDRVFLETDDFTHDVRLYINGDFSSKDEEVRYAAMIARKINGTWTSDSSS